MVIKRSLDLILCLTALLALLPMFLIIVLVLRLTGEREVFFRQRRIGYGNRSFELWKFVTMLKDSPKTGTITAANDPRILPVGRFLRKTKINELPQLINVLKGDMSIVGPRPLTEETFSLYPEEFKALIYCSRPGMTGIGSLVFRNEEDILARSPKDRYRCYREDIAPLKGELEAWYYVNRSLVVDLKIIVFTVVAILSPGNQLYRRWFRELPTEAREANGAPPRRATLESNAASHLLGQPRESVEKTTHVGEIGKG